MHDSAIAFTALYSWESEEMPISIDLLRQDAEHVRQSQIMRFKDPNLVDEVLKLDQVRDSKLIIWEGKGNAVVSLIKFCMFWF